MFNLFNRYESVYSSLYVAQLLRECMPTERFVLTQCSVQNMVAHVELPVGLESVLDIQAMYTRLGLNCTYQKRMFPGLIYRPEASPVVLLCFYSGKIVITGGKTLNDIFEGWNRLWPIVKGVCRGQAVRARFGFAHVIAQGQQAPPHGIMHAKKRITYSIEHGGCSMDLMEPVWAKTLRL